MIGICSESYIIDRCKYIITYWWWLQICATGTHRLVNQINIHFFHEKKAKICLLMSSISLFLLLNYLLLFSLGYVLLPPYVCLLSVTRIPFSHDWELVFSGSNWWIDLLVVSKTVLSCQLTGVSTCNQDICHLPLEHSSVTLCTHDLCVTFVSQNAGQWWEDRIATLRSRSSFMTIWRARYRLTLIIQCRNYHTHDVCIIEHTEAMIILNFSK